MTPSEDMPNQPPGKPAGRRRAAAARRRHPVVRILIIAFDVAVLLIAVMWLASVMLSGRDLVISGFVVDRLDDVLSRGLGGGKVEVGEVVLRLEPREWPQVALRDVTVAGPDGTALAVVPQLSVSLDTAALWRGHVRPRALLLDDASVSLRRNPDGKIDFGFRTGRAAVSFGSIDDAVSALRRVFALPAMAPVERIEIAGLNIDFDDLRAGELWRIEDGALTLTNSDSAIDASVSLLLPPPEGARASSDAQAPAATAALRLTAQKATSEAQLSALVQGVPARIISLQAPTLSWLKPLDAPVSGALIAGVTPDGALGGFNGTLEIGAGVFRPNADARPIGFDGARTYFRYLPQQGRLVFDALNLHSSYLTVEATGHADLEGIATGWPTALLAQVRFSKVVIDTPGLFEQPVSFGDGAIDARIGLDPFQIDIGQMYVISAGAEGSDPTRVSGDGRVTADKGGWHVDLGLGVDQVSAAELPALWPLVLAPRPRDWVVENLTGGTVYNGAAGIRFDQGQQPDFALSFEFRDTAVRFMPTLPPVTGAAGFAAVDPHHFAVTADRGQITPPEGGSIDVSGSSFRILETRSQPSPAQVDLVARGPVTAALSLLDQPPFEFLKKANQPVDLATGQASVTGTMRLPIGQPIAPGAVHFDFTGTLGDVRSDRLVPGKVVAAPKLALSVDDTGLTLAGAATLQGVPLDASFTLPFGTDAAAPAVVGTATIGADAVERLEIGLPAGMVKGAGTGSFRVELPQGRPPVLTLESDLKGIGLALPPLGWSKPAATAGKLQVAARLGSPVTINLLSIQAPGLSAEGAISLSPQGSLDQANFTRVSVNGWLDAPLTLFGRGPDRLPTVSVTGGTVDLRKAPSGDSGGEAPPITLALDRLIVSDKIALTGFRSDLNGTQGLSGRFEGRLNGEAPVSGTLAQGPNGPSIRLSANDAGSVLRAAGMFEMARGGALELALDSVQGAGSYDGRLKVKGMRVQSANALAGLLNAISVVGLIDELNGAGLLFTDVEAVFRLTPKILQVTRSSAVGPSIGITMEGTYDMGNDRLDMRGVLSPVYLVNAIGEMFTRKGEGLFGFNYRLRGRAKDPSVEVDPLSVLTPGMFRDLFRAAPPKRSR
ncbi:AsmA-like C-terminal region-containing protein [Tropicimonas sp. IMCC34043]|uniref:YhdP family protein n=1 Tax=Tropicimonas sp. IMCC34043 TaxID=2248760 RepID=UPI0013006C2A|nr:AsmA-like C-terminal region-containing protein [Tropicimonas sp. IMCC34043]